MELFSASAIHRYSRRDEGHWFYRLTKFPQILKTYHITAADMQKEASKRGCRIVTISFNGPTHDPARRAEVVASAKEGIAPPAQDPYNAASDRGNCLFDRRHSLTLKSKRRACSPERPPGRELSAPGGVRANHDTHEDDEACGASCSAGRRELSSP